MRRGVGVFLAMAALMLGGCGPLAGIGDPVPPSGMNLCCHGYNPDRLGRMAGALAATPGRDQLAVRDGTYRVRVEAVAISNTLPTYLTNDRNLYYGDPLSQPTAMQQVLLALLSLDKVQPAPQPRDGVSTDSKIMALAPGSSGGQYWNVDLLHGLSTTPAQQTVVVALVVPRGGTAVLCANVQAFDEPRLDLRTGRVAPGLDKVTSCQPQESPAPARS